MADIQCFECGKNLAGHPKIRLDGESYCYRCAKSLAGDLDVAAEQELKPKLQEYETQVARHEKWSKEFKAESPTRGTRFLAAGLAAVAFALFLKDGKFDGDTVFLFFFPGLIVGYLVKCVYVAYVEGSWKKRNPEPAYPWRPTGDFASDRVELVGGGTKGKQISGAYRLQILQRDGYRCQICGAVFPAEELEVHHVKPRAKRGKNFTTNLVTLCLDCHLDEGWFGHSHKMRRFRR